MDVTEESSLTKRVVTGRTGFAVTIAIFLANLTNYSFQVVTGRSLSVEEYGSLAGYMAAVSVITVSTSALQTMAARTIAAGENAPRRRTFFDGLTRSSLTAAAAVAVGLGLAAPLLERALDFTVVGTFVLAVYVFAAAVDSIAAGRLQGSRRFTALALYSVGQAGAKLGVVIVALALGVGVTGLLVAIVLSSGSVALVGRWSSARAGAIDAHVLSGESRRTFAAVTLFWVMLSMDVPVAQALFDDADAGIYAAGAVLGKAVMWLPVTVSQLVFPSLAQRSAVGDDTSRLLAGVGAFIVAVSLASVVGLVVLGEPIYDLLYGDRYDGAADVAWKIALAMVPLAVVNLIMLRQLARQSGRFIAVFVVATLAMAIGLVLAPHEASWFAAVMGGVGCALLVVLLAAMRYARHAGDPPAARGVTA